MKSCFVLGFFYALLIKESIQIKRRQAFKKKKKNKPLLVSAAQTSRLKIIYRVINILGGW